MSFLHYLSGMSRSLCTVRHINCFLFQFHDVFFYYLTKGFLRACITISWSNQCLWEDLSQSYLLIIKNSMSQRTLHCMFFPADCTVKSPSEQSRKRGSYPNTSFDIHSLLVRVHHDDDDVWMRLGGRGSGERESKRGSSCTFIIYYKN